MVPTKRFWALVAMGIPVVALSAEAGLGWVILAYNAALLLFAILTFAWSPRARSLTLTRKLDPMLSVRQSNRIEITLTNNGPTRVEGAIRDEPPPQFEATRREFTFGIDPGDEERFHYHLVPNERGSDFFRGTFVRIKCPLGLVERQAELRTEHPFHVYPNLLALREFELLRQRGRLREMGIRRARWRGLGSEFESLRDYLDGDDFRKIDWRASARRNKLIVRQYEQERNQSVLIVIDVGRTMLAEVDGVRKLDRALDAALLLARAASTAGDHIGLLVYAERVVRYIPPRRGRNQLGFVLEALHDLVADALEPDPQAAMAFLSSRWKRRSLAVMFTDVDDGDHAIELTQALSSVVKRHFALLACVKDPKVDEEIAAPLDKKEGLYRRAAASLVAEDRRTARVALKASGIHLLEAEPDALNAALVSYYFEVKSKSLL